MSSHTQETPPIKKIRCCAALSERLYLYGELSSHLSEPALRRYNRAADKAIAAMKAAELQALAELAVEVDETAGRGFASPVVNGHTVERWAELLRETVSNFEDFVDKLPSEDQADALRAGRDALSRCAVELSGAKAQPDGGAKPDGGAPIGG